jgi:hypothetical protein
MDEEIIKAEMDLLRGELISVFDGQMEIVSRVLSTITDRSATEQTVEVELRRLAAITMNAEHGVRSWRHPSGIVPRIPPMPGGKPESGQHPLATIEGVGSLPGLGSLSGDGSAGLGRILGEALESDVAYKQQSAMEAAPLPKPETEDLPF